MIGVNLLDCIRQKGVTLIEKLKIHRVLPGNSIDGEHSVWGSMHELSQRAHAQRAQARAQHSLQLLKARLPAHLTVYGRLKSNAERTNGIPILARKWGNNSRAFAFYGVAADHISVPRVQYGGTKAYRSIQKRDCARVAQVCQVFTAPS